ncbi:MAG: glycogen debranching enzyme family protein [Bacteroidetes bacterium]|nr:glycogen debranching enzyme family protein [Bacteroidota bacterium]
MQLKKEKSFLQDFNKAYQDEWLETNGLGGWSGSSVIGCNTRRYHGLLVAATKPPTERMVLVSKLDESIVVNDERFELGTNDYGTAIQPNGNKYLISFERKKSPEWIYDVNGIVIRKTISMVHDENTTLILYDVVRARNPFAMEFLPLIAARGYHSLQHSYNNIFWDVQFENGIFHNQPYENAPDIFISIPGSTYQHQPRWFYKFNYELEKYRGLDFEEDLFNHGIFTVQLKEGDQLGIILSTQNPAGGNAQELFSAEENRKQSIIKISDNELVQQMALAADQFIVRRDVEKENGDDNNNNHNNSNNNNTQQLAYNSPSTGVVQGEALKTIIAGYHWFTDWGRDTMISLPGLCLSTGRYADAKKIIAAFSKNVSMGMLPNRFQDNNEPPEYNNVDGTLWYFVAIHKYLQATNDREFILGEILPVLKDIIDWHFKGTRYNIHVDTDGLLFAGEKGQQLTWMDARIGDWVVTPRMGKPVEIQALWYNVLKIFAGLLEMNGQSADADLVNLSADKARISFEEKFWYVKGNYLYDVIDENGNPDSSLRPNQLFAISLPYALLEGEKANALLRMVEEKLYTPVGLRSLSPDDPRYVGLYGGDALKRDGSYHQGTVWSWLLGAYIEAWEKTAGDSFTTYAKKIVSDFAYHLNEGCIGSISEILDGDAPYHPRGCVAQAWGVAEMLRVIREYKLL